MEDVNYSVRIVFKDKTILNLLMNQLHTTLLEEDMLDHNKVHIAVQGDYYGGVRRILRKETIDYIEIEKQ